MADKNKSNEKNQRFNRSNVYRRTSNDYFYTNNLNVSNSSEGVMFIMTENNEKRFFNISSVLNILKGENTPTKQLLVNRLSDYFYNSNGIYSSIIERSVGILSFDRVITLGQEEDMKKGKKRKDAYLTLLRQIAEQYVAKDAARNCLRYGMYYGYMSYLEKNDGSDGTMNLADEKNLQIVQFSDASVIPLNPKYMRILSTDGRTYRVGIDISQLTEEDIKGLPQEIYSDIKSARDNFKIKEEALKKKNIKIVSKQYYILDDKKTIVIKLRSGIGEACGRAAFVTAIVQLIHDNELLQRKDNALGRSGKTLIYQTYPEGQKGKGTSALTKSQMEDQHDTLADTLKKFSTSEIGFASLYPNTKLDKVEIEVDLSKFSSDDIMKRIGTHSGFSMGMLNGYDIKNEKVIPFLYEMMAAEFDDFMLQWEKELNKVFSYSLFQDKGELLNLPYIAYLPTNRLNRNTYAEMYRRAFSDAGGSYQLYLASTGIPAEIHLSLMAEEEALGFREKYPAHPMASTSSFVSSDGSSEGSGGNNSEENEEGKEKDNSNAGSKKEATKPKASKTKQSEDKSKSKENKKKGEK